MFRTSKWMLSMVLVASSFACQSSEDDFIGEQEVVEHGELLFKKIAIVYSETTANVDRDKLEYGQLFAAAQHHATMAGLPFEVMDANELLDHASLDTFAAILLPSFLNVETSKRESILSTLKEVQSKGVSIITSGGFLSKNEFDDDYEDKDRAVNELFGLIPGDYHSSVALTSVFSAADDEGDFTYVLGEEVASHPQIWFQEYVPTGAHELSSIATGSYSGAGSIPLIYRSEESHRSIHIGDKQFLFDGNLMWQLLRQATGDVSLDGTLSLSRFDGVFVARNDMDLAYRPEELSNVAEPLLELIRAWKEKLNFASSYYIDIGNDNNPEKYTDWNVSGPLYQSYMELGNEIGTHSWTHPYNTADLTPEELDYEFKQSRDEIDSNLPTKVKGAAIPGNPEDFEVVETLNDWLEYMSGRKGPNAFGLLHPDHEMYYFSLNTTPDFTLIDVQGLSPSQSLDIWKNEIDEVVANAAAPIVHWLWHDYGPTSQVVNGVYSYEMFDETLKHAHSKGMEFATLEDVATRAGLFGSLNLSALQRGNLLEVNVPYISGQSVGTFAIVMSEGKKIERVANWYAYSDDSVFLPKSGGHFDVFVGEPGQDITKLAKLPMRAELLTVRGNGKNLEFSFIGQGTVVVKLGSSFDGEPNVSGASSHVQAGSTLTLKFEEHSEHKVQIKY